MSEAQITEPLDAARAERVWAALAGLIAPLPPSHVSANDALNGVLAEPVVTRHDFPPFDRAMMDGYAVRLDTFRGGAATLRDLGLIRADAGEPAIELRAGEPTCARINTGAPIPRGAEAVVMVEHAQETPAGVRLTDEPKRGQHIERKGAIRGGGEVVLDRGARITPGALATIAAAGQTTVRVHRRAQVRILTTGDELARPGADLTHGQIYDSNGVMLRELCIAAGADIAGVGHCDDDPRLLDQTLISALEAEVVIVAGGMSKGSHDLVPAALEALGVRWIVRSLDLKPGKPMRIGRSPAGGWVFGLPGNPVSCAVCFLLFARMVIDGLHGVASRPPAKLRCAVRQRVPANGARPMFHPARWWIDAEGQPCLEPIDWRGSGDPFGMSTANALMYRDAHAPAVWEGEMAEAIIVGTPF